MTPEPYRRILDRQTNMQEAAGRRGCVAPLSAFPTLVGQVFANPTVPTSTGQYFSVHPVDVSGPEQEAGAGVLTTDASRTFLVDVVGSKPAVAGDYLICRFVGNRWVADRMGTSQPPGVFIPGCPCALSPATLHMTSSKPQSNNGIFQSAVLQYGPTPAALLPVVLTPNAYLSTSSFTDPVLNAEFWYYLLCHFGAYVLTRVYVHTPLSSPFRDAIRYTWFVGLPGNTCTPFLLSTGSVFPGGDATCVVTISQ
jgi:hypothetical protein